MDLTTSIIAAFAAACSAAGFQKLDPTLTAAHLPQTADLSAYSHNP